MTALVGRCVVKASKGLKKKEFTYRCRDPKCNGEVILVCSDRFLAGQTHDVRTVHFRHKHKCGCSYCKGEGQWHWEWKSHFDRVEVRYPDLENGTLNIADAVVGENFVLEIQHYHIALAEADARENSYRPNGGMLWILDVNHRNTLAKLRNAGETVFEACTVLKTADHFEVANPVALFPEEWTKRSVAVVFAYGPNHPLLRLYPGRTKDGKAVVQKIEKTRLIEELRTDPTPFAKSVGDLIAQHDEELRRKADMISSMVQVPPGVRAPTVVRYPAVVLSQTNRAHIYLGSDGRQYSDYFGQMLPLTPKFARAIAKDQQRRSRYWWKKRRSWRF